MSEVPLAMLAWMSVVLFQAIVHFGLIGPRRRQRSESFSLGGSIMETSHLICADDGLLVLIESEEEDEPENFRQLLSQTGSELVSVSDHCSTC